VILIGLGVHSIFEGIATGAEESLTDASLLFLAIILHKGAAALSLAIALQKSFPDRDCYVIGLMTLFASFTPLGIVIGILIRSTDEIMEIVFSCLAAGTFIYIACSEVIIEEFSLPRDKGLKLLFFMLGIAIIISLLFLPG